mmetsp:Transcript_108338/g.338978  ORF Transcript_108338/g.338978 Transcript_108338/m.338978 type:complete len:257 (-) Transcript_108338:1837-2607(-)
MASERGSNSLFWMSASTSVWYSGVPSTMRHFCFLAPDTLLWFARARRMAMTRKRSSMVALHALPLVWTVTCMRGSLTAVTGSPLLMAWPRLLILSSSSVLKSLSRAPLTLMNSSFAPPSHSASSVPASMQLAQNSAGARTSPIDFTDAYSRGFMPWLMASALASSRHVFRSPEQLLEGFCSALLKLRFMIVSGSSPPSPAASELFLSSARQVFLFPPCFTHLLKTSPRASRVASFCSSWFLLALFSTSKLLLPPPV